MSINEYFVYLLLILLAPNSVKTMEWRMLRLLNRDRRRYGLKNLRMQDDLRVVARRHSLNMANKDFFDHIDPSSKSPADRLKIAGVSEVSSGENLAKIGGYANPTQKAQVGLMNSPGHRANILNGSYNAVGIGVIKDKNHAYYFTQNFAVRELVLRKKIPQKVKRGKQIRICGHVFKTIKAVLYQVKMSKTDIVIEQGRFIIKEGIFETKFAIRDVGMYDIEFYVDRDGFGHFVMVNSIEIAVKRGFFE